MFVHNVVCGILIGLPVMITVGPISLLLINQGVQRGARVGLPAAFGVAAADLTFAGLAALAGTALVGALEPMTPWLRILGTVVILGLAIKVALDNRQKLADLRSEELVKASPAQDPTTSEYITDEMITQELLIAVPVGGIAGDDTPALLGSENSLSLAATSTGALERDRSATDLQGRAAARSFSHLDGHRLSLAFYGITLLNPMSIILMSAVVVAGGNGVGSVGWAVGMALASLIAHSGYVIVGSVLRSSCSPVALIRVGFASSLLMVALAANLLMR